VAQLTKINDFLSVAGQISREDIAGFAKDGIATIINNRPDDEEPGQIDHETVAAEAAKQGLEYRYQPVTTSMISRRDVIAFQNAVLRGPQPVVAHCRSGTRCYLLWAASRALFERESPLKLVAEAAVKGYDLRSLPALVEKLEAEASG
jgi:sulfide:quinone oxidoreductase